MRTQSRAISCELFILFVNYVLRFPLTRALIHENIMNKIARVGFATLHVLCATQETERIYRVYSHSEFHGVMLNNAARSGWLFAANVLRSLLIEGGSAPSCHWSYSN